MSQVGMDTTTRETYTDQGRKLKRPQHPPHPLGPPLDIKTTEFRVCREQNPFECEGGYGGSQFDEVNRRKAAAAFPKGRCCFLQRRCCKSSLLLCVFAYP